MTPDCLPVFAAAVSRGWTIAGWTMLHFLWVGAAAGLVAAAVRVLLRRARPQQRYTAALFLLLLLAAAPVGISVLVAHSLRDSAPIVSGDRTAPAAQAPGVGSQPMAADAGSERLPAEAPAERIAREAVSKRDARPLPGWESPAVPPQTATADGSQRTWLAAAVDRAVHVLPAVWIGGSSLFLVWMFVGVHGADRLRRRSTRLCEGPIVERCSALARSLRISRQVAVAICERLAAPVLVGIVRPCILLPSAALTGWTPPQLEMVLLHELAHIRRWDNLVNLLQRVIESVLFFQPAVWWISNWVRLEREHCCDEVVVGRTANPREYAEFLLTLSDIMERVAPRPEAWETRTGSVSMARHHLVPRIHRLLKKGPEPMQTSRAASLLVLASLVAAVLLPLGLHQVITLANDPDSVSPPDPGGGNPAVARDERDPGLDSEPSSDVIPVPPIAAEPAQSTVEAPPADREAPQPGRRVQADEWPIRVHRARIAPGQSLTLASRRDGVLETVAVGEGEAVKQGQVLARLPTDALRIARIDLEYSERTLEAARNARDQAVDANKAVNRAVPEAEVRRLQIETTRAELQRDRASIEYESLQKALVVRSPIDGIVNRVHRQPGESVKSGDPVVDVVNTDQMQVEGYVEYPRIWQVRPGARVEVRIAKAHPDLDLPVERETFRGRITFVDEIVHSVTNQVRIRARVENRDRLLKGGLPAIMTIHRPLETE